MTSTSCTSRFTMFEIHQKKSHLVTLFDRQRQVFKLTIFGLFNELLFTQNVSVARLARHVECDFFYDFQTLWDQCLWSYLLSGLVIWFLSSSLLLWWLLASFALPINNTWLLKEWRKLRSKSSDLWSCNFHRQVTLQRMGKIRISPTESIRKLLMTFPSRWRWYHNFE